MLLVVFLAFGTYLVFDVLDVDGSRLPSRFRSDAALSIGSIEESADRLLRVDRSNLNPFRSTALSQPLPAGAGLFRPHVVTAARTQAARHPQILARHSTCRETVTSNPLSADPA